MSEILAKQFNRLSNLRRSWRSEMRPIFLAFQEGLKFRRESQNWSEDQKQSYILHRLRFAVRRANSETVYYRNLFREIGFDPNADFSFDDYAKLPILEREDVHQAGKDLVSSKIPFEKLKKDSTGGSTGKPTEIWLGAEERGWRESGDEFSMAKIGLTKTAKTAYFWGHHLDPQASDSFKDRLKGFATNVRWFDCFRLSPEIFEKYHAEFEKFAPDCIIAYASALGNFAEYLLEKGTKPKNYPRIASVTGAEKLFPNHRKAIEQVFGKPVHERYGGRDIGGIAIQVAPFENLDYEIDWAFSMIEPETSEENSSILVTKLRADGMPMLRYRSGDIGKFPNNSRSGNPVFYLKEVIGRELDRLWLRNGTWVHGTEFPHLLKDFNVSEFKLIQAESFDVELQIVPQSGFVDAEKVKILQTMQQNLVGLNCSLKIVDEIPLTKAGKRRPVESNVKK